MTTRQRNRGGPAPPVGTLRAAGDATQGGEREAAAAPRDARAPPELRVDRQLAFPSPPPSASVGPAPVEARRVLEPFGQCARRRPPSTLRLLQPALSSSLAHNSHLEPSRAGAATEATVGPRTRAAQRKKMIHSSATTYLTPPQGSPYRATRSSQAFGLARPVVITFSSSTRA